MFLWFDSRRPGMHSCIVQGIVRQLMICGYQIANEIRAGEIDIGIGT